MQVPQKGSVITWDFDILKGAITFTVLFARRSLMADPHEHHVSGAVGGIGSTQYIDKHMTVGVDISIVEPPIVCRDGDSIQVINAELLSTGEPLLWGHPFCTGQKNGLSRGVASCQR